MDQETEDKIRIEYPEFNDRIIKLISGEAYEKGHYAGQQEVNLIAVNIAYFVNQILKAHKG